MIKFITNLVFLIKSQLFRMRFVFIKTRSDNGFLVFDDDATNSTFLMLRKERNLAGNFKKLLMLLREHDGCLWIGEIQKRKPLTLFAQSHRLVKLEGLKSHLKVINFTKPVKVHHRHEHLIFLTLQRLII